MDRIVINVIGSLNMDLTTFTTRMPNAGETLQASSFLLNSGGKGANQAVACARLSRNRDDLHSANVTVQMTGAVGRDPYATTILDDLEKSGIDTTTIARTSTGTGVAIVLVEKATGQNRILISPGANGTLQPSDFDYLRDSRIDMVILQLEIPLDATLHILRTARSAGINVLLNPAPAVQLPDEAFADLAHLVLNETEAALLSGFSTTQLEDDACLPAVAKFFHLKGVIHVIVTLGHRGAYYSSALGNTSGFVTAEKVSVKDTTAAGDTFVGAYALSAVSPNFDLKQAVQRANRAAALTVCKVGAQQSIPWLEDLKE